MTEERKLVTVLFADIVGSTAATASEDPEIVRRTMQRAFGEMRELLTAHGGTVEKFIGDAVMAVFGIPQAHDDDAERAVRSAFALRSRIDGLSATLAFPLQLRIGVNTGRVVTGSEGADTLVTGAPVNAAARLQQSAAPGEIVVGAVAQGLTRGAVRYGAPRSIEAKGLGTIEAHPAEELLDVVPEQHRGLGALRAPLIGRDGELRLLREAWRRTDEEKAPALVTIYGQAGVGKSRLVAELIEVIGAEHVLRGRCLSYGSGITYWPLQEMIRGDAGIAGDDARDAASAKIRAAVLRAFGEASEDAETTAQRLLVIAGLARAEDTLPGVTGDDLGKELRWAVRRYVERRATSAPLALVFDDIHWAEPELLDLIEHLTERARAPLFLVCLARPDLRERRPTWGGGLTNASAVRLEPLDEAETRRLIAALLAIDDLSDDLRVEIVRRAEGNPLYVEELLRMLLESGQIERRDGRFVATGDIRALTLPPTLEGLLAARLDQLDAAAKRVVRVASVIGQIFYPGALGVLGAPADEVEDALTRAARRDLVLELDERGPDGKAAYSFKHILIRDAAYESLPKAERWQLHDAAGRWLEGLSGTGDLAGIVAHHAEQAFWIARELREDAAASLGERALQLIRAEARRRWELESSPRLKRDRYERVLGIAEALGGPREIRVEAAGRVAMTAEAIEGRSALPLVTRALEEARTVGASEVLVELLLNTARYAYQDAVQQGRRATGEGTELYAEATRTAEALGDPWLIALATHESAWPAWWEGRITEARDIWSGAYDRLRSSGVQTGRGMLLRRLASSSASIGDQRAADLFDEEFEAALPSLPQTARIRKVMPHVLAARRSMRMGDLEAWETYQRRAMEGSAEIGDNDWTQQQVLADVLHQLGRDEEALGEIDAAMAVVERYQMKGFIGEARQVRARILLSLGRLAEARADAERAYEEIRDPDPLSRSSTSVALGLVREAEGRTIEAERLLRQAVECTGEYGHVAAFARIDLGRFLMRHGRHAEARAVFEAALEFFVLPYAKGWHDRIQDLIRECDAVAAT